MFRGAVAMAAEDGRVVVFLEPIALYHEKDLHADGDGGWLTGYPPPPAVLLPGEVGRYGETEGDADLLILSYANGLRLSLQAAKRLADEHDLRVRVLDLRWLNPLPTEAIRAHAAEIGSVVVVDECRATGGGVADAIVADLAEQRIGKRYGSVRAVDSFVPLGPATAAVLVGVDQVVAASVAAARRSRQTAARRRRHAAARS
jgi:2-oxoisovalerate dehydrogenase E1 component